MNPNSPVVFPGQDQIRNLKEHAKDLVNVPLARVPKKLIRSALIVCNTGRAYRAGDGVAPIVRAIEIAKCLKNNGYDTYFIANPHAPMFSEYFKLFLSRTVSHLCFVYCGQAAEDGSESCVLEGDPLSDEEFYALVNEQRCPGMKLTLISDFTFEGSLFTKTEQFTGDTCLLTCYGDPAKENAIADLFVEHLTNEIDGKKEISPQLFYDSVRVLMKRNGIVVSVKSTSPELLKLPIINFDPRVERNELIL